MNALATVMSIDRLHWILRGFDMTGSQLIKLIHIAKQKLGLDDETYRALLIAETKKSSCSKMLKHELEKVYEAMKLKGFEHTGVKKKYGAPAVKTSDRRDDIKKIRAIWITMGHQGFISDSRDKALDAYVERMTKKFTGGLGIKTHAWLDAYLAQHVLESLKNWHIREMVDKFLLVSGVCYKNNVLYLPDNTSYSGYDEIRKLYEDVLKKRYKGRQK